MRIAPKQIDTARSVHRVATVHAYAAKHADALDELRGQGIDVTTHTDGHPRAARINAGRWIVDCECGAAAMGDPTFSEARCFHCGAIMTAVTYPPDVAQLEALLLVRPPDNRHWRPHETLGDVARDNAAHGLGG